MTYANFDFGQSTRVGGVATPTGQIFNDDQKIFLVGQACRASKMLQFDYIHDHSTSKLSPPPLGSSDHHPIQRQKSKFSKVFKNFSFWSLVIFLDKLYIKLFVLTRQIVLDYFLTSQIILNGTTPSKIKVKFSIFFFAFFDFFLLWSTSITSDHSPELL